MWFPHSCTAVSWRSSFCCSLGQEQIPWNKGEKLSPCCLVSVRGQNTSPAEGRQGFQRAALLAFLVGKLLPGSSIVCHLQSVREREEMGSDRSALWVVSPYREDTRREPRKTWGDLQCCRVFLLQQVPS